MKKILIVEDYCQEAQDLAETIADLGEVEICTSAGFPAKMTPIEVVIEKIREADLVLLDNDLGRYKGRELIPYCEGKKVVGISRSYEVAKVNFYNKGDLALPHIREKLREIVIAQLKET